MKKKYSTPKTEVVKTYTPPIMLGSNESLTENPNRENPDGARSKELKFNLWDDEEDN